MFSKRLIYVVDPHGAIGVAPEEVALLTSSDDDFDVTLGFRSEAQRKAAKAAANDSFRIPQQTIDVTIEKNGKMTGTVVSAITAAEDGVQVLPLALFPTLRVSGVWGPGGEALDFIQEDKERDADFAVVLQKPLKVGETIQITTSYAGKDAVLDMGSGNYFLVAREDWYPNVRGTFGNYAQYHMTFHTAKNVEVVATGNRVTDKEDGGKRTSVWQTMAPIAVAGFNLGEFKSNISERKSGVQVVSYANTDLADLYQGLKDAPDGGHAGDHGDAEACDVGGRCSDTDLYGLLRTAAVRPRVPDATDAVYLRAELADAGVLADLLLLGQHDSAPDWRAG